MDSFLKILLTSHNNIKQIIHIHFITTNEILVTLFPISMSLDSVNICRKILNK